MADALAAGLAVLLWLTAVPAAAAQAEPDAFVTELRRALAADDRTAVAALVEFPITVWAGAIRLPIADAAALVAQYEAVFTSDMKTIVAQGDMQRVTADHLTIARDAVEARRTNGRFRITRISVLVVERELTPAASAPASSGGSVAPRPKAGAPRRLTFRAGQRSVQWADTIGAAETDSYVLFIAQGQLLDVRLDRIRGREVIVRVLDEKSRRPVDARAGAGARVWTGRIPAAADYRIEVTRTIAPSEPPAPYLLTVSFK